MKIDHATWVLGFIRLLQMNKQTDRYSEIKSLHYLEHFNVQDTYIIVSFD